MLKSVYKNFALDRKTYTLDNVYIRYLDTEGSHGRVQKALSNAVECCDRRIGTAEPAGLQMRR